LVEVSGEAAGRDIIAMQLAETMRETYFGWRGSITAGLQQSVREANRVLFEENRNALPGDQRTAGVSCVVLRDENLFIAQAGPAAIYLAQEGKVSRFPDVSPWLDDVSLEEMDAAPVGDRRDIDVGLFHTQVGEDTTFLLVESPPARRLAANVWPTLLSNRSAETVLDALRDADRNDDLAAVVVKLGEERVARKPAPALPGEPEVAQAPAKPSGPPIWEQVAVWWAQLRLGEHLKTAGQAIAAALLGIWVALTTFVKRMAPGQISLQPTLRKQEPTSKKPMKSQKTQREPRAYSDLVQKLLIGVAVAIPIIVAVVVLATYIQRGQDQRAELEALWLNANTYWEQAQATNDPAAVRRLLEEAERSLDQLLEQQPDHADAAALKQRIVARLDEINQVRRISWIAELSTYPANANLTRIVVEGVHVFVMDRNEGKVYHHQLDEYQQALLADTQGNVLVSKGDQVGDVLVGDLVDMTWMPAGNDRQKANLLILESGGRLIEYDPATGERVPLRLAASDLWQFPKLVGSYFGRFYLLDPSANQIWRYPPTPDGYSALPDEWLQTEIDLAGVVDMAIGNSIYLLYADGKMRKLTGGQPDTFDTTDWDRPASSPTALFTRPPEDTQWVYVADRGNSRIVQAGKDGRFRRQFRLADAHTEGGNDPLGGVTSLFVDEISGHAYFLSGQKFYLVILPD
jgi:hypothetical protein